MNKYHVHIFEGSAEAIYTKCIMNNKNPELTKKLILSFDPDRYIYIAEQNQKANLHSWQQRPITFLHLDNLLCFLSRRKLIYKSSFCNICKSTFPNRLKG
jgi:hypothetical protein